MFLRTKKNEINGQVNGKILKGKPKKLNKGKIEKII